MGLLQVGHSRQDAGGHGGRVLGGGADILGRAGLAPGACNVDVDQILLEANSDLDVLAIGLVGKCPNGVFGLFLRAARCGGLDSDIVRRGGGCTPLPCGGDGTTGQQSQRGGGGKR